MTTASIDQVSFGVGLYPWGKDPPTFEASVELATLAERLGYDAVHVPFHLVFPRPYWIFADFGNAHTFDSLSLLAGLAARTDEIGLATNAAIPNLHNPVHLARTFATIDHMSDGRTTFGVAPGWIEEEFTIVGTDYERRGRVFERRLATILECFRNGRIEYERGGTTLSLSVEPTPKQEPHPPIWYGGTSRTAVDRAARWADTLCVFCKDLPSATFIRDRIGPDLEELSAEYGRDGTVGLALYTFAAVTRDEAERAYLEKMLVRSFSGYRGADAMDALSLVGDPEEVRATVVDLVDQGVDYFVLDPNLHGLEDVATARRRITAFKREVLDEL